MKQFKTPYFVIDQVELDRGVRELREALVDGWGKHIIGYSFKTNSLPWINKHLLALGCYAEVVSSPEYRLALEMGYEKEQIIFNGPVKDKLEFCDAVLNGSCVNIDSRREVEWLKELALTSDNELNIGVRVNVELPENLLCETGYPNEGSRFGFCISNGDLYFILEELQSIPKVSVKGLHLHLTSKTRSLEIYELLANIACEVKRTTLIPFEYIDIGGGFFGGLPGKPSFRQYVDVIASELKKEFDPEQTTLIVEPGSALIAAPISFFTEVVDVKENSEIRIATVNGSRTNIDPLMIKKNHFYRLSSNGRNNLDKQLIVGFTCMEMDRIMIIEEEPELNVGDLVIFDKVGAYTMSLNPLFIQYFPSVYVYNGMTFTKVRERWGIEEYIQKSM